MIYKYDKALVSTERKSIERQTESVMIHYTSWVSQCSDIRTVK